MAMTERYRITIKREKWEDIVIDYLSEEDALRIREHLHSVYNNYVKRNWLPIADVTLNNQIYSIYLGSGYDVVIENVSNN